MELATHVMFAMELVTYVIFAIGMSIGITIIAQNLVRPSLVRLALVRRRAQLPSDLPSMITGNDCMLATMAILTHLLCDRDSRPLSTAYIHLKAQELLASRGFGYSWETFNETHGESISTLCGSR